jgi:hypothetical protein
MLLTAKGKLHEVFESQMLSWKVHSIEVVKL